MKGFKKRLRWIPCIILSCIVIVCFLQLCFYLVSDPYTDLAELESPGEYKIISDEAIPRESLTELASGEGDIFVYYAHSGLVNRYTDTGEFCYGIQVYSSDHGEGGIAFSAGRLYIVGPGGVAYVFEDTALVQQISGEDNPTEYLQIRTIVSQNNSPYTSGAYQYVPYTIIRCAESGESEVIISFPKEEDGLELCAIILMVAVMGLMLCVHELWMKSEETEDDSCKMKG